MLQEKGKQLSYISQDLFLINHGVTKLFLTPWRIKSANCEYKNNKYLSTELPIVRGYKYRNLMTFVFFLQNLFTNFQK